MSPSPDVQKPSESLPLRQRWLALREAQPRTRARDAAEQLGVSEAELVASGLGEDATRLELRLETLLPQLESLGPVMALTRNTSAVHEKRGVYRSFEGSGSRVMFLGEDIDLRLFLSRWHFGFAVQDASSGSLRRSLQFFDESGTAIHKVHLEEGSNVDAFDRLVKDFAHPDTSSPLTVVPVAPPAAPRPDSEVDVTGLRDAWRALKDTHEFFGMLRKFEVTRQQALRLGGPELATAVAPDILTRVLEKASATELPIMIFVGNPGAIQIHTGPVRTVRPAGPWMNVMDPAFNLHVRADHITSGWVVRKPTVDGMVTSVELFDAAGENIALLFGKRKPGQPEDLAWRTLAEELARTMPAPEVRS
ncbi:hemin-degrading factor [Stigmatella aurantiaca]|uniref:Hemin transport protein HemS n=1 Tax=Stigmatella aurantiaca (strain DW4/3-1) TaxID=378806 RepID=Q09A82_STIAD|nr:hemin-degrading factor [Stigmatella aurantiaca]ADO75067.1 Hemin transport protein HemS [Stigmatella aurantiaca DW4/3-1]EAU68660.1 hemin transport protein HmuS [Stigmatella aurantiaca DW4/3-1]